MELPPRYPGTSSQESWARFMREVLNEYLPSERKLIEKIKITVDPDGKPWAEANVWSRVIAVSWGRIVSFKNITECAALLAHELGHVKHKHPDIPLPCTLSAAGDHWFFWQRWIMGRIFFKARRSETYETYLYRKEEECEIDADRFMAQTLPRELDPARTFADLLERTGKETGLFENYPDHPFTKIHLKRIAILRQMAK